MDRPSLRVLGTLALALAPVAACADLSENPPATTDDDAAQDDDSTGTGDDDATPDDGLPDTYRGLYVGLQFDPSGNPVVAYYDKDRTGVGLATLKGSKWVHRSPAELGNPISKEKAWQDSKDWGRYLSFAISGGTWHLAFQDVSAETLQYASSADGVTWTVETADSTGDGGWFASLAVDASGNPAVCHYDAAGENLRLAVRSGGSWTTSVVDEGTPGPVDAEGNAADPDVGRYCSIAADGSTLTVAYYDAANGDLKLATGLPGTPTVSVVDSTGDVGAWPTLFKASGGWVISYHAPGDQDLKLAVESGGAWTTQVIDAADYVGADSAIAQVSGRLSIAYFDGVNNDVKLATDTGSGWSVRTLGSGSAESTLVGAVGYSNNVLADASGQLHVATFRYDTGDFAYAKTSP